MNGYNFSERVRKVLALARNCAMERNHVYVGTEHILLAIIREGAGVATAVLQNLDVDLHAVETQVDSVIEKGKTEHPTGPDLPYTSRAKKVLELSMAEARNLNHTYVGTEHLLIGLLREEKGIGAQVLNHFGATTSTVRAEVLRLLGDGNTESQPATGPVQQAVPRRPTAPGARPGRTRLIESVSVEVRYQDGTKGRRECADVLDAIAYLTEVERDR